MAEATDAAVTFAVVDAGGAEAQTAMGRYVAELDARFDGGFDGPAALAEAVTSLNPPHGLFLVARRDLDVVAGGGIQFLDDRVAELRRMWVRPDARGSGIGRRLLGALERQVGESGRSEVVLDTNATLVEAVSMYERCGYRRIPRYNDNPYAQVWFAKSIGTDEEGGRWP